MTEVMVNAEELAALRAAAAERDELAAAATAGAQKTAAAADEPTPPTHWATLADGQVIETGTGGTHHSTGDGTGDPAGDRVVPIAALHPMG